MSVVDNLLRGIGRRAADAVSSPSGYWPTNTGYQGIFGSQPTAGIAANESTAMASATAYACTRAIAETMASLPAIVFEEYAPGSRRRARDHDAWNLLHDRPCPIMDSTQFWEIGSARSVNRGVFFAEIERDRRDRPIALWPLHNSRVTKFWNQDELEWHVVGDKATVDRVGYGSEYHVIRDRDMLRLNGYASMCGDGVDSWGVLGKACEEISLDLAMQQYGASFFGQGGRPNGVVEHPGFIKAQTERDMFWTDLNKMHAGRENWNKIGVLWQGATWKELSADPQRAQFIESRGYESKVLCRFYNVPPAVVQIFDDYKFSTVDAMLRQFVMLTIRPLAVRWERAIRRQVLHIHDVDTNRMRRLFDKELVFEFLLEALLRGDPKQQAEVNEIKWRSGSLTNNEWRAQDNQNPLPDGQGDHHFVPLNFTTIDRVLSGEALTKGQRAANGSSGEMNGLPRFEAEFLRQWAAESLEKERALTPHRIGFDGGNQGDEANDPPAGSSPAMPAGGAEGMVRDERLMAFGRKSVLDSAGRLVRVEHAAIRRCVGKVRSADDAEREKYREAVAGWMAGHADRLTDATHVGCQAIAEACGAKAPELVARGAAQDAAVAYVDRRLRDEIEGIGSVTDDDSLQRWKDSTDTPMDDAAVLDVAGTYLADLTEVLAKHGVH